MQLEDLSLHQLQLFVTLAEEQHFTRSAEKLFMSQPALTRQIRKLEDAFKARLFDRGTRSVNLTRAGEVLFHEARRVLDAAQAAIAATERAAGSERDLVALGSVESAMENLMPRVMASFCQMHPKVAVRVLEMHTRELERSLLTGSLDCAIVRPPLASQDLSVSLLYTEPLVAVTPEDFHLDGDVVRAEQLRNEQFIVHTESLGTSVAAAMTQICIAAGFVPSITETGSSTAEVLGLIAAGRGITLLPKSYTLTRPYGVRMLAIEDEQSVCGLAIAWRPGEELDPTLRDFLGTIRQEAPHVPDTHPAEPGTLPPIPA